MTAMVLFGSMICMLIIGVPISISLGAATMAALLTLDVPLAIIPQRLFTALDSVSIMAIPFFVLAGNLMTEGGISRRLVDFCNSIIGNVRGGLAYAMVLACAFFAALYGGATMICVFKSESVFLIARARWTCHFRERVVVL